MKLPSYIVLHLVEGGRGDGRRDEEHNKSRGCKEEKKEKVEGCFKIDVCFYTLNMLR
jgi:hypothetical protein